MGKQVFNPFLPDDVYIPDGEPPLDGSRVQRGQTPMKGEDYADL